jgi:hypothetical protein
LQKQPNRGSGFTILSMDKLQLAGQDLGRVFNFISGHLHAAHLWCY